MSGCRLGLTPDVLVIVTSVYYIIRLYPMTSLLARNSIVNVMFCPRVSLNIHSFVVYKYSMGAECMMTVSRTDVYKNVTCSLNVLLFSWRSVIISGLRSSYRVEQVFYQTDLLIFYNVN